MNEASQSIAVTERQVKRAWNFKDLTGQRFGRLVVVRLAGHKIYSGSKNSMWLCKCDCGKEVNVSRCRFKEFCRQGSNPTGKWGCVPSCGCSYLEGVKKARPGYRFKTPRNPGQTGLNTLRKQYSQAARYRDLEWSLSDDEFAFITKRPCHYCGTNPSSISASSGKDRGQDYLYNGVDRKDNSAGYTVENSLPCCSICNWAKHTMKYEAFIQWLDRVSEFRKDLSKCS